MCLQNAAEIQSARGLPSACHFSLRNVVQLSVAAFSYFKAITAENCEASLFFYYFIADRSLCSLFDRKTGIVLDFDIDGFIRLIAD
jgi:hypothetical protein